MKNLIRIGLVCLTAFMGNLHAQSSATFATTSIVPRSPESLRSIQSYSDAQLTQLMSALEATPLIWPTNLPNGRIVGTYWSLAHPGYPPLPMAFGTPFWNLSPGSASYSAMSSPVSSDFDSSSGFFLLDDVDYPPVPGDGGGGTNVYNSDFQGYVPTTNDLYLQIISVSNSVASLVIHPPWNVANGVYDLYYTTNLAASDSWQWLLRTEAGETNLPTANASDAQGFYDIRPPSDLAANDSLGTNFWTMFCNTVNSIDNNYSAVNLSLYISSPLGAMGKVTILGVLTNGPILIVTNCGDASVNGTYVLTNMTAQEQADWTNSELDPATTGYEKGTDWAGFSGGASALFEYDAATHIFTALYYKAGYNLNGSSSDWQQYDDTNVPTPTTICPQVPLTIPFSVAAGAVTNINIPRAALILDDDNVETNSLHVISDQPVSVYGLNYCAELSTAFTAYPTPLLGTNYCVIAYAGVSTAGFSQLEVVAAQDSTTVWITPSARANLAGGYTNTYSITLNQGQTYQNASLYTGGDVTGTRIASDKPVAVFAGANAAYVPVGTPAGNPLVQEQLPVEQWGDQALAMSLAGRLYGDSYRILAAYTNTMVWTNGVLAGVTNAGEFLDLIIDGPVEFQASQPIQVAQFANGARFDSPGNNEGDPCEILLLPTGHYLMTNIVVTLPNDGVTGDFDENFLNLIVPQSVTNATFVNGSLVAVTNYVTIGGSGYCAAQLSVTNGVQKITSSQPIGVEVYGLGNPFDAYGYFGGIVK